ncbi:hypothetical protein Clacol_001629 [Clathrus columnatus]|uniref:RNA polymerase III transcription factor IIIC subunit-domain-containing protein n=1 Tax=Clathrus columnatus TaxID=1419009 RepID=A0AAV4ZYN3_9AGAM|nr:hypothetical protein Clacol_001629 [Clathrus columnatus]
MQIAPSQTLSTQVFYSIEYPGFISPGSVFTAIETLGGQSSIDNVFARRKQSTGSRDNLLDLNFRPENVFSHPVPGETVGTNKLLLKLTKRRVKRTSDEDQSFIGDYTGTILGIVPKTVRFRSLVDFQYQPDMTDSITRLRVAMGAFDAESIREFRFDAEKEQYSVEAEDDGGNSITQSNLRLIPPPIFSRQGIPQIYNFKQNPMSTVETSVNVVTGLERKRYINRFRWKGWSVVSVSINDTEVPSKPLQQVEDMRDSANQRLYNQLRKVSPDRAFVLFEERPVWTKLALLNQFSEVDAREINNTKYIIPLVCYVFIDGPWRDTLVRFSYDPRRDNVSRFYQRIYFRNVNNPMTRPSVAVRAESRFDESLQDNHSSPDSETASFQLCDIVDPLLKDMIASPSAVSNTYDDRYGWYLSSHFENIKTILRYKFFSLLEGQIPTDVECQKLLDTSHETGGSKYGPTYRRTRKHNKAKGALPPEEEAVG